LARRLVLVVEITSKKTVEKRVKRLEIVEKEAYQEYYLP
jgi:hypothetical protein